MEETLAACPLTRGRRILVALDGSVHSERAFEQALSLAKVCKSTLFLISVLNVHHQVMLDAPEVVERMSIELNSILNKAKNKVESEGLTCETIVHIGADVHEFIIQEAKDKGIDLIAMGTRGRTGLKRMLMGSVAQKVICYAPCPVLITPCS